MCTGALYQISSQDLYQRSLCKTSEQDLLISRGLLTRPVRGICKGALYKISSQDLSERSLYKISALFTGALYKVSSRDLLTRPPPKIPMQDLYAAPRSLHRGRKSFTREISIQDLLKLDTTAKASWHARNPQRVTSTEKKMLQAEPQRHSVSQMSTALQPERSNTHKVRRWFFQTWNRHRATARRKKS